jgi:hypothetical protein
MDIIQLSCTSDVVTLTVTDASVFVVGEHVHIFNTGYNKLDGHHNLLSVNNVDNKLTYSVNNQTDIAEFSPSNATVNAQVTWITADDVADYQGWTLDTDEETSLLMCVDAANEWAYKRRLAAGYVDNPTVTPGEAAKLGTVMYCVSLFNERGSLDQIPSFSEMPTPAPVGSMGQIMRLLGIGRGRIG